MSPQRLTSRILASSASLALALGAGLVAAAPAAAADSPVTPPTGIQAEVGASSVTLTWEPATSSEAEITNYTLRVGNRFFFTEGTALTLFLQRDTTYRVLITARDENYNRAESEPFFFSTSKEFPVTTPGNVQVSTSPGTVAVEWEASSSDAGIRHYHVTLDPNILGTSWGDRTTETSSTFTFPAGGTFEVTVRAEDEAFRYSDRSDPINVTVDPAPGYQPPTTPENLQVEFDEQGRTTLASWDASEGTGPISYRLRLDGSAIEFTEETEFELFSFGECGDNAPFPMELTVVAAAHGVTSPPSNAVSVCF